MSTLAWPVLLLAFGLILLAAEVFIPSGGLIGLLALSLVGVSLYTAFRQSTDLGMKFLIADFMLMPLAVALALYIWPKTPLARRVFLRPPTAEDLAEAPAGGRLDHLIGEYGRALTTLRPSGMVDFDGRRLGGMAEEGMIDAGTLVRAVQIRYGQLVVRTADAPELDLGPAAAEA